MFQFMYYIRLHNCGHLHEQQPDDERAPLAVAHFPVHQWVGLQQQEVSTDESC